MDILNTLNTLIEEFNRQPGFYTGTGASLAAILGGLLGTAVRAFLRRVKESDQKRGGSYFAREDLLAPPIKRPAYSDRMAYLLGELSDLAYFEFEGTGGAILDAAEHLQKLNIGDPAKVEEFLNSFARQIISGQALNRAFLEKILEIAGFQLIDTVNIQETQAFVCKYVREEESSYIAVVFRGTEKKISDWLTKWLPEPIPSTF